MYDDICARHGQKIFCFTKSGEIDLIWMLSVHQNMGSLHERQIRKQSWIIFKKELKEFSSTQKYRSKKTANFTSLVFRQLGRFTSNFQEAGSWVFRKLSFQTIKLVQPSGASLEIKNSKQHNKKLTVNRYRSFRKNKDGSCRLTSPVEDHQRCTAIRSQWRLIGDITPPRIIGSPPTNQEWKRTFKPVNK